MPGKQPSNVRIYRIVHRENVEYILTNGMYTKGHLSADPNYINIGDSGLIAQRNDYPVGINPPNGLLGDYVPFYFGPLSPMLFNIKTGHRGIPQISQNEIVYICCNLNDVITSCREWCFTNGHAKNLITEFYNNVTDLNKIDWNMVSERYWSNTEEDFDRMRRKQAEFLVKNHVPPSNVSAIVVSNEETGAFVGEIITRLRSNVTVHVNPKNRFYY